MPRTYSVVVFSFLLFFASTTHAQTAACDKLGFISKQGEQFKLTTAIEYLIQGGAVLEAEFSNLSKQDSFHTFDKLFYFNPSVTKVSCSEDSVVFVQEDVVNNNNFFTKRLLLRFLDGTNTLESVTLETRRQLYPGLERWSLRLRHVPFAPNGDWIALYDPIYPSTIAYLDFSLDKLFEEPKRMTIKNWTDSLSWVIGVRTTTASVEESPVKESPIKGGVSCSYLDGYLQVTLEDHANATLIVSDVLGRTILSQSVQGQNIIPLPLTKGRYFVRVIASGKSTTVPIAIN